MVSLRYYHYRCPVFWRHKSGCCITLVFIILTVYIWTSRDKEFEHVQEDQIDRTVLHQYKVSGCTIPIGYDMFAFQSALIYRPLDDDFFIASYPKSGTTWTQQIVYLIRHKGRPSKNMLEFFMHTVYLENNGKAGVEKRLNPYSIKTHLPYHMVPFSDEAKYLYVVRNPKDVLVSSFYFAKTYPYVLFEEGNFDDFFEYFIKGNVPYDDYFDHVLGWYEHRNDPNVMVITYEEMKRDHRGSVLKIAKFMGRKWYQMLQNHNDILDNVIKYSGVEYMRSAFNPGYDIDGKSLPKETEAMDPVLRRKIRFLKDTMYHKKIDRSFIRTGVNGDWRHRLTEHQNTRLDLKIEEKLQNTDLYTYWKTMNYI